MTAKSVERKKPQIICPVVLKVAHVTHSLTRRARVVELSRQARKAVAESARNAGSSICSLVKDEKGVPIPKDGLFWSLSHKPEYVAGVVAPQPVGIDLEKIRSVKSGMYAKVAHEGEWELVEASLPKSFFRFFTAKEAVLKATGIGLRGLKSCKVIKIDNDAHLTIDYQNQHWCIEHFYFENHMAAVVKNGLEISWILEKS